MTKVELKKTTPDSIAPCGMNCSLCRAYGRQRKPCPGCRGDDSTKTKTRVQCGIKNCEKLTDGGIDYCFSCSDFPCKSLLHLDSRYKAKYGMSMIENLASISKFGIQVFVKMRTRDGLAVSAVRLYMFTKLSAVPVGTNGIKTRGA